MLQPEFIQGTIIPEGSRNAPEYTLDGENLALKESRMTLLHLQFVKRVVQSRIGRCGH